jgi:hypothetical protein
VLRVHEVPLHDDPAQPASTVVTSLRQILGLRAEDLVVRLHALGSRGQGQVQPSPTASGWASG